MGNRRVVAVAAVVAAALVVGTATPSHPAWAGGQGEAIIADVDGDGIPDRNTLRLAPGSSSVCEVVVEVGLPGGGFGPGQAYPYLTLPVADRNCPDMGVGLNLDTDPPDELAVAWFAGPPPGIDSTLLALDSFQVSAGFDTIFQPSYIGTADFNGDGRQDIYEWTDQGDGFATYLNTGTGALVPGPVRYCSGRPDFRLADVDKDGAMDVVIAYLEGCGAYFSGVVVVLDDGTVVDLHTDVYGDDLWTVEVLDANGDGHPDVRTTSLVTGTQTLFLGTGAGGFHPAPTAVRDFARVSGVRPSVLAVLANDFVTRAAVLTIVTPPRHGTVRITSARTVVYRPNPSARATTDRFDYRVSEQGRTSDARVTLHIVR
ncbi:FG-GAP-like repeat-containing protein [Micromonospora sp. HM5-17]|jgi:hypothetical protein|uniref:FG-GAP-like repeat-containing protein n=1 Tax=Micromonospora sp. HM5-17 TaxID=2487710 RepID=UPI000F4796AB|nr:FG-GAP-like repeat-containing protein [Micromonospora sp. HM5-17]ROT31617.1 VCBS repeat-containing protein [Micromonospora sp. HM5-17]